MFDFFQVNTQLYKDGGRGEGYSAKDRQNISTTQFYFFYFLTLCLLTNKSIILMSLILALYLKY